MNKVKKEIFVLVVISITLIIMLSGNNNNLKIPKSEELSSIILVDIIGNKGVKKTVIYQQLDINNILDILSNSKKLRKQSISQLPENVNFTIALFEFKSESIGWRSIYEEENNFYIDQPFDGIFRLDSNDLYLLGEVIKRGSEESISVQVEDIGSVIKSVLN